MVFDQRGERRRPKCPPVASLFAWLGTVALCAIASCGGGPESPDVPGSPTCIDRVVFGDPAQSLYVLPYPVGTAYTVLQSYCSRVGSHANQLAYDFAMPIGSPMVADLHFGVYRSWPIREGFDVPVNFRNAEGPLGPRGGLQRGVSYVALPY